MSHLHQHHRMTSALRAVMFTILAAACGPLVSPPIQAQISFGAEPAQPLAFSISGGISLGSYQAGVNYGLLELFRRAGVDASFRRRTNIPRFRLTTVTGASAGNINTVLWMLEACTRTDYQGAFRRQEPESSLFWQFWEGTGWNQLFHDKSDEPGLFSRDSLISSITTGIVQRMQDTMRLQPGCSVPAGITLTRLRPKQIRVEGIPLETQRQATLFQLEVTGDRRALFIDPLRDTRRRIRPDLDATKVDPAFGSLVQLAVAPGRTDIPLDSLLNAVKASSSFPFAFSPVPLWVRGEGKRDTSELYLDGGVFDNNPLGLARVIFRNRVDTRPQDTLPVVYVNPGRTRSGDLVQQENGAQAPGGLAAVISFLPGAVTTARQYELQLLARERERLAGSRFLDRDLDDVSLVFSSRHFAVFGNHLQAFAGFLARPARQYDFYVGLYDALHTVAREFGCVRQPEDRRCVSERLRELVSDPVLLGGPAQSVVSWLYASEFRAAASPEARACRADGTPNPFASDTTREGMALAVQCALFRSLGVRDDGAVATGCVDKRVVLQVLCKDRFLPVLEALASDTTAARVLKAMGNAAACDTGSTRACQVEGVFLKLVDDPVAGATSLFDQLLDRAVHVEKALKQRGESSFAAAAVMSRWAYNATYLRSRPKFDPIPGAAPRSSRARFVPISSVGINLGAAGSDVRLEPTINLTNPYFLQGSVIYSLSGVPGHNASSSCRTDGCGLGGGGAVGRYFNNLLLNRVGVHFNRVLASGPKTGGLAWASEMEVRAVVLSGQLFLSPRFCFGDSPRCGTKTVAGNQEDQGFAFAIGLADPIGLFNMIKDRF